MDPITLAILAGTAATAAGQLPQLIPSKFERENKARLEALQRQKKAGTLGLTGQEEALMERRLAGRSQAAGAAKPIREMHRAVRVNCLFFMASPG